MGSALLLIASVLTGQADDTTKKVDPAAKKKAEVSAEQRAELARKVRKLVRQLDSEELAEREAAEKALVDLGPKILDLIPPINDRTPGEVKERIGRVVKILETKVAAAATTASRITLNGEMSLQQAFAALQKQSGNKVSGIQNGERKVKLALRNATYWESLDLLLDKASLEIDPFGGLTRTLSLVTRPEGQKNRSGTAHYSGLFRFQPTRIECSRNLRNSNLSNLRLYINISWEPSSTPISLTQPLNQVKAQDENGKALPIDRPEGQSLATPNADISAVTLEIPLKLPSRDTKKIKSIEGTLNAIVPGRVETFEFTDLTKVNQPSRKAGVSVVFQQIRKNGGLYQAGVLVRFDEAANALESHRGWIFHNEAYMVDDKGKRIPFDTLETTSQSETSVGMNYFFNLEKDPKNYKLVYKTPALIVKLPVKFKLTDIDLP